MKKPILLIINFLLASVTFAQTEKVYFLKNDGKEVKNKSDADFIRIIQDPDSGSVHFKLIELYPDNKKLRIGTVSKFEPSLVYEGTHVVYYKNGKKQEVSTYANGKPVGVRYFYYENGKITKSIEEAPKDDGSTISKLMSYFDTSGVQIIKDGNGHFKTLGSKTDFVEEGDYTNGLKNGNWTGKFTQRNTSYSEIYENGQFVEGEAKLNDGTSNKYTKMEEMPEFQGGLGNFYKYIGDTYKYPVPASRNNIKGKVIVTFVVEEDGAITDAKIVRDLGYGTGEEALRVVKRSPRWIPGRQHGIPVRVSYTLPIELSGNIR